MSQKLSSASAKNASTPGGSMIEDTTLKDPITFFKTHKRVMVRVKINRPKTMIVTSAQGIIHVDIAAPPHANKANIELIKYLTRVTKNQCRIVSGATHKLKIVEFG